MTYVIVIVLVLLSGIFSGLTLGLLSLDKAELKRKISLGNKDAKIVYPVRRRGNLLLCTLLVGNVAVNSTLSIFLGTIASGLIAGLVATALIVVFGEILPQATFSRYALQVGAKTAWLVKIFMFVLYPVCAPIAFILDKLLGEEMNTIYSKKELMKIVEEHKMTKDSAIDEDEDRIIKGALSFSDKSVKQVMTPRTVVYSLEANQVLDKKLLEEVSAKGFTRIPVYEKEFDNIIGVLYVKELISVEKDKKVGEMCHRDRLIKVAEQTKLDDLLNTFLKSKTHLAFVVDEYGGIDGIVSLEDVIEEIFNIEIVDETDTVPDMQKLARKKAQK